MEGRVLTDLEVAQKILEAMEEKNNLAVPGYLVPIVKEAIVMSFENMANDHPEYLPREQAMIITDVIDGVFSLDGMDEDVCDTIEDVLREVEEMEDQLDERR